MSSRLTDKEAKLLTASIANVNGGPTAIMNLVIIPTVACSSILKMLPQIDFSKVYEPAGYKDIRNAKVMFVRLMSKIVDDGLEGTPGRSKSGPKAKKGSAGGDEDVQSSPSAAATPVKPSKKRKVASELVEEDTPTKRVGFAPKGAAADGEEVLADDNGTSGKFFLPSHSINASLTRP